MERRAFYHISRSVRQRLHDNRVDTNVLASGSVRRNPLTSREMGQNSLMAAARTPGRAKHSRRDLGMAGAVCECFAPTDAGGTDCAQSAALNPLCLTRQRVWGDMVTAGPTATAEPRRESPGRQGVHGLCAAGDGAVGRGNGDGEGRSGGRWAGFQPALRVDG